MKFRTLIDQILRQEDLNFLLTNRIPRRAATLFMGRFSKVNNPLIRTLSIAVWKFFSGADLSNARKSRFDSLHDAFIRELKPGSRPIHPDTAVITSPCDGIIGAHGRVSDSQIYQAKGYPYKLDELLPTPALVNRFKQGTYLTIRITAGMYHRFHAPTDGEISRVTYITGDTWNVNPIALKRVESLFCKNERAVIESTYLGSDGIARPYLMIPVAAILVASIRLHFADVRLHLRYSGPNEIPCTHFCTKGEELGWFEHGSTIILIFPEILEFAPEIKEGKVINMGEELFRVQRIGHSPIRDH